MTGVLLVLGAAFGVVGALRHIGVLVLRVGAAAAHGVAARNLADATAQRGDLTAMGEHRAAVRSARTRARLSVALLVVWIALLVVPLFTPYTKLLYATLALSWALPLPRVLARPRPHP